MASQSTSTTALDTVTLNLPPTQAPVLRTILSSSTFCTTTTSTQSEWYAYEVVYWTLDPTRDPKQKPEFRVFSTSESPSDEMQFAARCETNKLDILASKIDRKESEGEQERVDIAFIAYIPVKPDCLDQAKAFLTGPYAQVIQDESYTHYWYAFQRDATTLGLFGAWAGEEELKQHMEGGVVEMLEEGMEPFMSGPFERRKGSMIAYKA